MQCLADILFVHLDKCTLPQMLNYQLCLQLAVGKRYGNCRIWDTRICFWAQGDRQHTKSSTNHSGNSSRIN